MSNYPLLDNYRSIQRFYLFLKPFQVLHEYCVNRQEYWGQPMVGKPYSYGIRYYYDVATWTLCIQLSSDGEEIPISLI